MRREDLRPEKVSNKPRNIRYHNQKLALSLFRSEDILSVSEISRTIKLSKTTVTKMVADFCARGLVLSAGKGSSTEEGGKKPELFELNADYAYIVIAVVRTNGSMVHLTAALSDMKCRMLNKVEKSMDGCRYDETVGALAQLIGEVSASVPKEKVRLVIVPCSGVCDADEGEIYYSFNPDWERDLPIKKDLNAKLDLPNASILVDNISRYAGYSTLYDEGNTNYDSIVFMHVGKYTSGAVLKDHALSHGANGFIGEFGHMVVEPHSPIQCDCGQYGCFGKMVSTDRLVDLAREKAADYPDSCLQAGLSDGTLTPEDVLAAIERDDPLALEVLKKIVWYFSLLLHNIMLVFDPSKFVIGGTYADLGERFFKPLLSEMEKISYFDIGGQLRIDRAKMSFEKAVDYGAALYATHRFYNEDSIYSE